MMLLWDGSSHAWLEERGPHLCLMGALDDATGELLEGAHFVAHECSAGYLRVLLEGGPHQRAAVEHLHGPPRQSVSQR